MQNEINSQSKQEGAKRPPTGRYSGLSKVFLAAFVFPPSVQVSLGGLALSPLRVLAIYVVLAMSKRLFQVHPHLKSARWMDNIAIFHVIWVFLSFSVNHGVAKGVESGGIYFVEFLGFYILGREIGKYPGAIKKFIDFAMKVILILALFAWVESFTGRNILKSIFGALGFGFRETFSEPRLGLNRAYASFGHPILYGLFGASLLSLTWYVSGKPKTRLVCLFVLAVFPSLSSAPLLALTSQFGLITWGWIMRKNKNRWWILMGLVAFFYVVIDVLSNRDPITVFMYYLTFNSQTGYMRQLIWQYGSEEVLRNPVFGIGFSDWQRPAWMYASSVDNFWLLTAMRHGLLAVLSLFVIMGLAVKGMVSQKGGQLQEVRLGWIIGMVGMVFVGSTVHFWGTTFTLFSFLLGVGVSVSCYRVQHPNLSVDVI